MPAKKAAAAAPVRRPLGQRFCRLVVRAFAYTYLSALALVGISMIDPFGLLPRPLAGVFLLVLGLPWTLAAALWPDDLQPIIAAVAPAINWFILGLLCAWFKLRRKLRSGEQD